mmetsp:Transcript_79985/g.156414  ORF Transcript_79985/g.156414 Transcript_79985/m.156414 type:complete len:412 (+) Transcript_79985:56-1291(+)
MVLRSAVHTAKGSSKNRATAPPPKIRADLPAVMREQRRFAFDKELYDLHGCILDLLLCDDVRADGSVAKEPRKEDADGAFRQPIGCIRNDLPRKLENLELPASAYRDTKTQAELFRRITTDTRFLEVYTKLLHEVVVPHLEKELTRARLPVSTTTPPPPPPNSRRGENETFCKPPLGQEKAIEQTSVASVTPPPPPTAQTSPAGTAPVVDAPVPVRRESDSRAAAEVLRPELNELSLESSPRSGVTFSVAPTTFYCQFPPTLRLQPGPATRFGRPHNDAEYGHQVGEINFWLPLTNFSSTLTALWVESAPGLGDFAPLDMEHGVMAAFHGTLCKHHAEANPTTCTRVSLDFRVGIGEHYDPHWVLRGTKSDHGRIAITPTPGAAATGADAVEAAGVVDAAAGAIGKLSVLV